jgi:hypothetical protein
VLGSSLARPASRTAAKAAMSPILIASPPAAAARPRG